MHANGTAGTPQPALSPDEIARLRQSHYNATVATVLPVHEDLRIIRVVPDGNVPLFAPGQYFTLGLGNWEPRVAGVEEEHLKAVQQQHVCQRAYSASCSILDEAGQIRRVTEFGYLEFYVALVRHAERRPPALTPRLFALHEGDRLFVSPSAAGRYTLAPVGPDNDAFFFATGTGEAPHNAMVAELLARGHQGRIVCATSVRYLRDAAYRACHQELVRRFPNYRYFLSATRETIPENDPARPASSLRLPDAVRSGSLERDVGFPLDPGTAQVFLCGNPAMIGFLPHAQAGEPRCQPGSMLYLLLQRGFHLEDDGHVGNVHFERYW